MKQPQTPAKTSTLAEYQRRINLMVEYINNHLDKPLNLNKLAEISCFSPYHFHRIVNAFLNENIGAYIARVRVETAARLLRYTSISIQEISEKVGYETPSSLSKSFKQLYGISPSYYRNHKDYTIMNITRNTQALNIKGPSIIDMPEKTALYIRLIGNYKDNDYDATWQKLWTEIKTQKLFSAGIEHFGVCHDDPHVTEPSKLRYDACLVVHKTAKPHDEIGIKQLPCGKFAKFVYQGSYEYLNDAYNYIFGQWLPNSGYELRNVPSMEKYANDPRKTAPEKLKTEFYIPIL